MAKKAQLPLTERQADALSRLLGRAIADPASKRDARTLRVILEMLDHAVFLEE
jgi:hypothetical protein